MPYVSCCFEAGCLVVLGPFNADALFLCTTPAWAKLSPQKETLTISCTYVCTSRCHYGHRQACL